MKKQNVEVKFQQKKLSFIKFPTQRETLSTKADILYGGTTPLVQLGYHEHWAYDHETSELFITLG